MNPRSTLSLLLCASLVSPAAAQTRAAAASNAPAGVSLVPQLGGSSYIGAPSLGTTLSAPALSQGLLTLPAPALTLAQGPALAAASHSGPAALAAPVVPAAVKPAVLPFKAGLPASVSALKPVLPSASLPAATGEAAGPVSAETASRAGASLFDGEDDKDSLDAPVPVAATLRPGRSLLSRAKGVPAAAFGVLPGLAVVPHFVAAALPYVEGTGVLGATYAVSRAVRYGVDKLAVKFKWDKNAVALWRFASSVAVWTAGAGLALAAFGVSGTVVAATFGAGGTAMALAITLAVKDTAGNLFHGVHFLLTRPFTIGDKVTIGKTTATVHDLTLRYMVLVDEQGRYVLRTYSQVFGAAVTLYGEYRTKELRVKFSKPALPRGFLRAIKDAATPALWKPVLWSAAAIAALTFFPLAAVGLKGTSVSWLAVALPWVKAGLVATLTSSISRSLSRAIARLGERYGWNRPLTTVAKLGAAVLAWIVGGSFLLNAVGISWAWLAGTLSISTVLVSIAVNDYVSAIFQAFLTLRLKPFEIGDENVSIGEHTGTVVDVTWQYVVLKLDDGRYMLIPHSVVKDSEIKTPREYGQRAK